MIVRRELVIVYAYNHQEDNKEKADKNYEIDASHYLVPVGHSVLHEREREKER